VADAHDLYQLCHSSSDLAGCRSVVRYFVAHDNLGRDWSDRVME
jgi:hypothetical protein